MKVRYFYPLIGFVLPTVVIGYGFVIPTSCIAGINDLTIGFGVSLLHQRRDAHPARDRWLRPGADG
jgi:hypothetical protein